MSKLPIIDLRSDTVTKPSKEMLEFMFNAEVGDDVFVEDPTVNALEKLGAEMFGMEAALFCSSGTQTNQIAINIHAKPGSDVICEQNAHIHLYEGGGIAANSGASVSLLAGQKGLITAQQIKEAIKEDNVHFPATSLIALENTANKGGGTIYNYQELKAIAELSKKNQLPFHLDGARVFNAIVEANYSAKDIGNLFDSVSVCLSKGLGAPVGSLLVGNKQLIHQARRVRKRFGGGMRQAGYLAAAGIYALKNNVDRLKEDHEKAKFIGQTLQSMPIVKAVQEVETNIVMVEFDADVDVSQVLERWEKNGIKALSLGPGKVRLVTHLDITDDMMSEIDIRLKA